MTKRTSAKAADFLLDIHTEPFPARFVPPALEQLKANAAKWLAGKIEHGEISSYGTLRHLVLVVKSVAPKGLDKTERFKGPKEQAWKTPDGKFTPAAEGFARKYGLSAADLIPVDGVLYAEVATKGAIAGELLAAMVPELMASLQFPKFMVWESTNFKFGRPLRAITAVHGEDAVAVREIAGIKTGNLVYGHPTYAEKPTKLSDPSEHLAILKKGFVIADPAERRDNLLRKFAAIAKEAGGQVELDEELVDETVFMTEHPTPVVGRLRAEHMHLPPALLKMVMKKQLKFFPVVGPSGELKPAFVGVRDGLSEGDALVREGYQRVLEARFNDAAFFFGRDTAATLESRLDALKRVTYQKALGSVADKAKRVEGLAAWLCSRAGADASTVARAAKLAYADLVTDVVKEFPELQGHMGGVYARRDGLGEGVATAVEQFYWPVGAGTALPTTPESRVVALAGKLDGIAGCFAAGLIPSGSADPYGLRRQALGIVRILLESKLPVDLDAALAEAVRVQPIAAPDAAKLVAQIAEFAWGRVASFFEEQGYRSDEIRSVRLGGLKNLADTKSRLEAVHRLRKDAQFEQLAAAFKRASNILKQAKGVADGVGLDDKVLQHESEKKLSADLGLLKTKVEGDLSRRDYEGALIAMSGIKAPLDRFFDSVMVMVEDEGLKRQRLALLAKLVTISNSVADLSEIQASAS